VAVTEGIKDVADHGDIEVVADETEDLLVGLERRHA
jgi:hypothetical protein